MNCKECTTKKNRDIPFIAYELECARQDRRLKHIMISYTIILIFVIAAFVGYVIYDRYIDSTYEWVDESIEVSTEGGGNANYIGNDGDVNNYGSDTSTAANP